MEGFLRNSLTITSFNDDDILASFKEDLLIYLPSHLVANNNIQINNSKSNGLQRTVMETVV